MIKKIRPALLSLCLTGALAAPALAEGGDFNDQQQQLQERAAQAERDLGTTDFGPGGQIIHYPPKPAPVVWDRRTGNVPVMSETEIRGGLRKQGYSNVHGWYFDRHAVYHVRAYDNLGRAVTIAVRGTDGYVLEVLPYWY